ncbi:Alpha/beta hydrolase [Halomicronema hongdechloris C2206]|uniref:Proline iminopeptidase n=1 Tax=Halomicronema hongdechloris C2206 TaxID=1641165 RepID=A0A1Z3HNK2_9CYAN|nr:prolyl aminopeptidase [Halomicronema hongdechloris]ASC71737.1 Alpha/beta hydrolase [Halomicronema hongdechloris C2206]
MRQLYPALDPYYQGYLPVSDLHTLYFEESGCPEGQPVVFLHGGPGGGTQAIYRQFFDPHQWRIVLFDQRGCGQSTPHAELTENTTWHLVADIERLRSHLGIDRWIVFGGSWGSTLALAYAQSHPDRCRGLILRGIFTLRPQEIRWFYQAGANHLFPDAWEQYLAPIPPEERHDLVGAYYRRLTNPDPAICQAAARAWSVWEASTSKLLPDASLMEKFSQDEFAVAFARIECHYFIHGGFFEPPDQLLRQVDQIRAIPGVIVQGRYDVVCPMITAWELHRAWPEADFIVVPNAGHSATEAGILSALVDATDRFAQLS